MIYIKINHIIDLPNLSKAGIQLKIKILLFANLKEIAQQASLQLDVPETAIVGDIIDIVKKEIPDIAPHFKSIMIAVNMIYVENSFKLNNNDEVALIPPASGG